VAIALKSDPIVAAADVAALTGWSATSEETYAAINAVSAMFREYTGRQAINETAGLVQIERFVPAAVPVFYLRATPVAAVTQFQVYDKSDVVDSLVSGVDYYIETQSGRVSMETYHAAGRDHMRYYKITYSGGWDSAEVPGDVVETAVEMMKLLQQRRQGLVGVTSTSADGMSTTYTTAGIPSQIMDVWQKYRIY